MGSSCAPLRSFPRRMASSLGRDLAAKDARENGNRPAWHVTPVASAVRRSREPKVAYTAVT